MENLEAMADLRYTGFRGIMDRDVLALQCIYTESRRNFEINVL